MKDVRQEFWENPQVVKSFTDRPPSTYITNVLDELTEKNPNFKILDIGCGAGRYSKYLKERGLDITALDKHEKIAFSLQKNKIPFILANMSSIPLKTSNFELILSIGVLHNAISLDELKQSVSEISRLLKPKGYLLCSIFTNDIISDDLTSIKGNVFLISKTLPMILLSKKDINSMFVKNGLYQLKVVDEHITNVGTGERYVYSALFQKG